LVVTVLSVPDGSSLTEVTVLESATVPALYWVMPPLVLTSAKAPLTMAPAESSTRRTVKLGAVPLKLASGRKRSSASPSSSIALDSETAPMSTQLPPARTCQTPPPPAPMAVTATPAKALATELTWLSIESSKWLANRAETVAPGGSLLSSKMAARLSVAPTTTGASFTGLTSKVKA
jgi:hypothetical protein